MKAAQKRVSAFTVFKTRSKENVNDDNENNKSMTKKTKQTAKKLRSSLRLKPKSGRPSCLPDSAVTPARKKSKKLKMNSSSHSSNDRGSVSSLVHTPVVELDFKNKQDKKRRKSVNEDCKGNKVKQRRLSADGESDTDTPNRGQSDPLQSTVSPKRFLSGSELEDSGEEAEKLFEWMIGPVEPEKFFKNLWERKPLLVKRHMPDYNSIWFSTEELNRILREEDIQFTVNLDVTTYTDGRRETHNPQGRAHAPVVWDYYQNGCSVRFLNPQTFSRPVWKLLSTLQEFFSCGVGANVYLTPPGSQGFAPHFDDIEAFVVQLEGKKRWRLYSPRSDAESLPRFSSTNFSQDEIGDPILDVVLEAGDLLYFPRGIIHQADTPEDSHSLHMTVSTYQRNTWGDLLEKMMPQALKIAFAEDPEFRKSLPRDYTQYMGVANSESNDPNQLHFIQHVGHLISKLIAYAPVHGAADQMAVKFLHDSLPPMINRDEKPLSVFGAGAQWRNGKVEDEQQIFTMSTQIKLIRRTCIRLVMEDDAVLVYYNLDNAKVYHGKPPQSFEIPAEAAPAVECLLKAYPEYVPIKSLPAAGEMEDKQIEIAQVLFEKGILLLEDTRKIVS
ncbi:ribosomal oxygenase 1-like [Anneissia japonica]|uniref:ribosomal oxygenase 1-like n=1 Tax=Anneissia japonica TaxID=1529436 RepID=UPI0014254F2F|nr:ribosomal oxygenase 1-like [Anneissia japonica]